MKLIASVFILWVVIAGNIFAETSTSAKNPYVEERLSNEEKALYYKDPLKYMESLAITSDYRALELSLYYQGWAPEVVFFRFDEKISPILLAIPTKKEMTQNVKMRDKEKARYWAEKHTCGRYFTKILAFCNLSNLLYSKNPTTEEAKEFYFRCFLFYHSLDSSWDDEIYGCGSVYAHALHKGTMDVPVDLEAFHKILTHSNHLLWRNFYSGFFAPKDKEFAKYILSLSPNYWDMQELSDIYKGKYDSSDVNPKLAEYWQKKAEHFKKIFHGKYDYIRFGTFLPETQPLWKRELYKKDKKLAEDIKSGKYKCSHRREMGDRATLEVFHKKYNILRYGSKQKGCRLPFYAFCEKEKNENQFYNRELTEQIIENLLSEGEIIEPLVAKFAYDEILLRGGVDEDLIEKFFKKAIGGKYYDVYRVYYKRIYHPRGWEIYKKRFIVD